VVKSVFTSVRGDVLFEVLENFEDTIPGPVRNFEGLNFHYMGIVSVKRRFDMPVRLWVEE